MHTQFNKLATNFLGSMIVMFPNEMKLKTYLNKFEILKTLNSRKPVEMFMESMIPFGSQIISRDEDFFKKDEYINNAENISGKIGLVDHWESLDSETKDKIWTYINSLYILGLNCLYPELDTSSIVKEIQSKSLNL